MAVIVMTRYTGGTRDEVMEFGPRAKALFKKHGASWRISQAYAGNYTGQWIAMVEYPNWEAYGKGTQSLLEDPEYQVFMMEIISIAKLEGRGILHVMDI